MTTAGPIAIPIMTAVNSFGVTASSTMDASSQMAANMAMMSMGCRTAVPFAGNNVSLLRQPRPSSPNPPIPPGLFFLLARRRPQHEVAECGGDRPVRIVLPGARFERDDAPALLDDGDVGEAVERATG